MRGGGVGWGVLPSRNSKWGVGGAGFWTKFQKQGVLANLSTNSALPLSGSLCITDSLSRTTYVETNKEQ